MALIVSSIAYDRKATLRHAIDQLTPAQRDELRAALSERTTPDKPWSVGWLTLFGVAVLVALLALPHVSAGMAVLLAVGCAVLFVPAAPRAQERRTETRYYARVGPFVVGPFAGDEETDRIFADTKWR